jgi:hypothetical protein
MIRNSIEVSIPTNIPVREDGIVEVPINATDLSFCGGFTIHIAYDRNLLQSRARPCRSVNGRGV